MSKLIIRQMEEADLSQVCAIEEETFSMPWSPEAFLQMITKEDTRYYVAEEGGHLLGGCGLWMIAGEGNITNVAVAKDARRRGVGTGLLTYLMQEGNREGVSAYTLEVRISNEAAIHMYEKLGFVSEGIRPNFYEKPAEDAMIMWKR